MICLKATHLHTLLTGETFNPGLYTILFTVEALINSLLVQNSSYTAHF